MTDSTPSPTAPPRLDESAPATWLAAIERGVAPGRVVDLSIETRPAPGHNATRPWVLPVRTWRIFLGAMGLDVLEATPVPTVAPGPDPAGTLAHWSRCDPYRDPGGAWRLRVRRAGALNRGSFERSATSAGLVLAPTAASDGPRVAFLIGSAQDYHLLLPLIEAFPPGRRTVWVRHGAATLDAQIRRGAIVARLTALGLEPRRVSVPSDADWNGVDVLATASESTANSDHLLNAAFVVAANMRGVRTCQLQHGIVPLADFTAPIVWFSSEFHAWGRGLLRDVGRVGRPSRKPIRALAGTDLLVTGCPKFDRYSDASAVTAVDVFGDWAGRFERTVLVATNLHWGQHRAGGGVWEQVRRAIHAYPNYLFVLKLHPVEPPPAELADARPDNVVIVDERVALYAGLDTTRLVRASDLVVSTPSTVALEAALAAKPFVVLETGNPNRYRHVTTTNVDDLGAAILTPPNRGRSVVSFRNAYIDPATAGTATARAIRRLDARQRAHTHSSTSSGVMSALSAFGALAAQRDAHAAALEAGNVEKDAYVTSLREAIEEKDKYSAHLLGVVEALKKRARPA